MCANNCGFGGNCVWIILLIIIIVCCCGGGFGFGGCGNKCC